MLMLQRAAGEDSEAEACDALTLVACSVDPTLDGCDACNAGEEDNNNEEDVVVKSGELAVTASAAEDRKVIVSSEINAASDLDTLTFKTSEEVSITKVTLERYGYSTSDNVEVRLEDQEGNVIAEAKGLSKDKATLSIKKDYRNVDGEFVATIVLASALDSEWNETELSGSTIGFKVTAVESTAENLNLKNYTANTYDIVEYAGNTVYVELKGTDNKNYNYVEGESYEIARLKVKAGDAAVYVKGFTLNNAEKLDMAKFLDKIVVTADGEKLSAKANVNKDDELVISFDEIELDMNKSITFVVTASFTEDFDEYGEAVAYYVAESADFNATEKKNWTRVTVDLSKAGSSSARRHAFNGGKIKLSNTKLGNVDAAQASEDVVVAEGNVTVTEPIYKMNFVVTWSNIFVENLKMYVAGEEYEATRSVVAADQTEIDALATKVAARQKIIAKYDGEGTVEANLWTAAWWTDGEYTIAELQGYAKSDSDNLAAAQQSAEVVYSFKNVAIEKSGKVQFRVDILDNEAAKGSVSFDTFSRWAFSGAKYENTNETVSTGDVAGSISFAKVTIQPAKAALENNLTKEVEFINGETSRKVVFDGTYTAKKGTVNLNNFQVQWTQEASDKNDITFYLYIDGEEVADADLNSEEMFSDVLIEAGESVKVKVEAEIEAETENTAGYSNFYVILQGSDMNGNENSGKGTDTLVIMKVKTSGSTTISAGSSKNTVLLRAKNQTIAAFTVKPSNSSDTDLYLDTFTLAFEKWNGTSWGADTEIKAEDIRVKVDGVEEDVNNGLTYTPYVEMWDGIDVEVILKNEVSGAYRLTVKDVNGGKSTKTFTKRYEDALVYVASQEDLGGSTKFDIAVEKYDEDVEVSNLTLVAGGEVLYNNTSSIYDGDDIEVANQHSDGNVQMIDEIVYCVASDCTITVDGEGKYTATKAVVIKKTDYSDYFKVGSTYAKVFASK